MNTTTTSTWHGWHRPDKRSPWRVIVTAGGEADAFNRLLDAVAGGDKCVLPDGENPNEGRGAR